ncbi:MAG: transposase family protein [Lachnospiraceae bacterium]|nr:transposase family protein [Lachnospiraceae bacterium]
MDWLGDIPDPRNKKNQKHALPEIMACIVMGFLNGKTKLRRIRRWCRKHLDDLRRYRPFKNGIPSLSTFSRVLAAVDEELLSITIASWIGEIVDIRGRHLAIDGKGLRAAAKRLKTRGRRIS